MGAFDVSRKFPILKIIWKTRKKDSALYYDDRLAIFKNVTRPVSEKN